jgi:hypothetical protein
MRGLPCVVRRHTLHETEAFRSHLVTGTQTGVDGEWYLGHGFSAGLSLGISPLPGGAVPLRCRVRLSWYPYEGVLLTAGYDLFSGWLTGWEFQP